MSWKRKIPQVRAFTKFKKGALLKTAKSEILIWSSYFIFEIFNVTSLHGYETTSKCIALLLDSA